MKKILYLECNSGISGDMTVGALLDLGADQAVLEHALESLGVGGYHLHFGRKVVCGLDAFDFDVHLEEGGHGHDYMAGHDHAGHSNHEGHHDHGEHPDYEEHHDHGGHPDYKEHHDHGEHFNHEGSHSHEGHHSYVHRNLFDVYHIIDRLDAGVHVKELAKKMFLIVAEAESKAHGLPIDQVHFHEVGAIDSIVDIISVAVCIDNLGVEEIIVSPLAEGHGHVRCQHGILPVPVPATANIAAAYGLNLRFTDNDGEMVTPTGAAIAAALRTGDCIPDSCRLLKIGMGAGNKEFKQANVLRVMLLEAASETASEPADAGDDMWIMESNIDDCTGENLGFVMELLLDTGAADVWYTPVFMKKNRPAYQLSVLCKKGDTERLEEIILVHTTTIGVRRYPVERTVLAREKRTVQTVWGEARVKVCTYKNMVFFYPEYEDVKALCKKHDIDFQTVYYKVRSAAEKEG